MRDAIDVDRALRYFREKHGLWRDVKTAAGEVDTATVELRSPSPAALNALTANTYSCPPESPLTLHAVSTDPVPSHANVDNSAAPSPSLRYTKYPVTAAPVETAGADQTRSMPPVCEPVLARPLGAAGLVDTAIGTLRSPSRQPPTRPPSASVARRIEP